MQTPVINIGANIILQKENEVLLGKRLNQSGYGDWGFIGGHVEKNETLLDAAKREVEEETCLVVDSLVFLGAINQPRQESGAHYIQFVFASSQFHGELENKEPDAHEELKWFPLDALPENIFFAHVDFPSLLKSPGQLLER